MTLGVEVGLGPGDFVLDAAQLPQKRAHPNLWPMYIVAKRLPISATGQLLYISGASLPRLSGKRGH